MTLGRVTGSLIKPWSSVEAELTQLYGDPDTHNGVSHWKASDSNLFEVTITVEPSSGDVEMLVSSRFAYTPPAVAVGILAVIISLISTSAAAFFLVMTACLLVVGWGLAPGWLLSLGVHAKTSEIVELEHLRFTPMLLFPVLGFISGLWATATSFISQIIFASLGLFILVLFTYSVAGWTAGLRRQLPVFVLPVLTAVPILLTVGNLGLLSANAQNLPDSSILILITVLILNTIVVMVAYVLICQWFVSEADRIPNKPIESSLLRILWGSYFLCLNGGLILTLGVIAFDRFGPALRSELSSIVVTGFLWAGSTGAQVLAVGSILVLMGPLIAVGCLWGWHLTHVGISEHKMLAASEPVTNIDAEVPVYSVETSKVLAHPIQTWTGTEAVVVSSIVVQELDEEALQAVVAHEVYHLRHRDPLWIRIATVFGVVAGGKNVLVALFDYPKIEREADEFAADRVGTHALIRALRRLDQLQASGATTSVEQPAFLGTGRERFTEWLSAPYEVLFGAILLEHAHADVDTRVSHLLDRTE